jgi:hypothetical protein
MNKVKNFVKKFLIKKGHGCLSGVSVVCVCQVEVSATG